jgi:hypothetical protein
MPSFLFAGTVSRRVKVVDGGACVMAGCETRALCLRAERQGTRNEQALSAVIALKRFQLSARPFTASFAAAFSPCTAHVVPTFRQCATPADLNLPRLEMRLQRPRGLSPSDKRLWGSHRLLSNAYQGLRHRKQSGRGLKLISHL